MSQKINPKSLRLGNSATWDIKLQNYGRSQSIVINSFFKYLKIYNLLNYFNSYKFIVNNIECWHTYTNFHIRVSINNNINNSQYTHIFGKIEKNLNYFYFSNFNIYIYSYKINCYSAKALINYASYLFMILNYTPKKIFSMLVYLLTKQLYTIKICYAKLGPLKIELKGFKIILKGRFESSKSQMSKELKIIKGSLPLSSFNVYIDFWDHNLYTKLGVCSIKIWLFYQIN